MKMVITAFYGRFQCKKNQIKLNAVSLRFNAPNYFKNTDSYAIWSICSIGVKSILKRRNKMLKNEEVGMVPEMPNVCHN